MTPNCTGVPARIAYDELAQAQARIAILETENQRLGRRNAELVDENEALACNLEHAAAGYEPEAVHVPRWSVRAVFWFWLLLGSVFLAGLTLVGVMIFERFWG